MKKHMMLDNIQISPLCAEREKTDMPQLSFELK